MDITFVNPGFQHSIDSIMLFQNDAQSDWWRQSLFAVYPQLNREHLNSLPPAAKKEYLRQALYDIYQSEERALADKVVQYNSHWRVHQAQVTEAFSQAFAIDCSKELNRVTGSLSLNPICPRFLDTASFDVFYLNSHRGALGIALHELVHFAWFRVWSDHFHDDPAEYETPNLKWIFSEMAVDPIMRRDSRLSEINPYFAEGCAYDYFYRMNIDGRPILESLYDMYTAMPITDFMEQGYAYCLKHEGEIRAQMK